MKVYFINLDRSPERLAWFKRQADGMGLDLVRVPAVDGRELPVEELERWRKLSVGDKGRMLSPGEIGCFLSHRRAWEMVRDGTEEWAFVAEDDIHFSKDAAAFLTDDGWIPAQADLIKAETDLKRHEFSSNSWPAPGGHELRQLKSTHLNTGGYFLTREAAARLLAFSARKCDVIDGLMFAAEYMQEHGMGILQVIPAICIQDAYLDEHTGASALNSILNDERLTIKKNRTMTLTAKLRRETKRIVMQAFGLFARIYLTLVQKSAFIVVDFDRRR